MRSLLAAAVIGTMALPFAAAQDACTEAEPCPWTADVDAQGFEDNTIGGTYWNGTAADWHQFSLFNFDEVEHTISVDGYGLSWTVGPLEMVTSEPFQLDQTGSFAVRDEPSGDTAQMNVLIEDVVDDENGTAPGTDGSQDGAEGGEGTPWPAAALGVALLLVARRKRRM